MAVNLAEDRAFQVNTQIVDVMELWLAKDERQRVLVRAPAAVWGSPHLVSGARRSSIAVRLLP